MLRSISYHSSSRIDNELNPFANAVVAPYQRCMSIPIFRNHQSIKKALSLIFNKANFKICNATDENEMHEFIRHTSSEENINTIHQSESNISGDTIINQSNEQSLFPHATCTTTHRNCILMHRTFSHIKNKIKIHRYEPTNNHEKNNGYLVVVDPDSDPVLLPNDSIGQQETQHAHQPCVQISDVSFDLNQIQYLSPTPTTPNLSPLQQPLLGLSIKPVDNHANHELEVQSTRSGIECVVPHADFLNIHDTQMSYAISTTSPSSTNSLTHEYTGTDRSILDDTEYVRAQQLDLEHLTIFEINLSDEYRYLQSDLAQETKFHRDYEKVLKENSSLKEELNTLKEEYELIHSPWSCELCTLLNQAYIVTRRDICEVCESPSPLKRATLTK